MSMAAKGRSDISVDELAWFKKYTQSVVYMATKSIENPFKPGSTVQSVEPDGIGVYGKIYNSDYYNAVEAMVVPLKEMKQTISEYLIPLYAERWLAAGQKTGWTEENPQFIVMRKPGASPGSRWAGKAPSSRRPGLLPRRGRFLPGSPASSPPVHKGKPRPVRRPRACIRRLTFVACCPT